MTKRWILPLGWKMGVVNRHHGRNRGIIIGKAKLQSKHASYA